MVSTANAGTWEHDSDHRLQSAVHAFHVDKCVLCDKILSLASRVTFFDAMTEKAQGRNAQEYGQMSWTTAHSVSPNSDRWFDGRLSRCRRSFAA